MSDLVKKSHEAIAETIEPSEVVEEQLTRPAAEIESSRGGLPNFSLAKQATRAAPPIKTRRWPISFGPAPVPPFKSVTVQAQPRVLFRGEKIINTGDVTGLFVQGLFVGQKPQLPTFSNPIPVSAYSSSILDRELMLDTCDPALAITFQVMNATDATLTWAMTIVGRAII